MTIDLPTPRTPQWTGLIASLRLETGVKYSSVELVLTALAARHEGPRYVAEVLPAVADAEGNHSYVVTDRQHGWTVATYHGFFAGQDARDYASILNGGESR